jgi:hypothetical protein
MTTGHERDVPRPGPLRRLFGWLAGRLPGPPEETPVDPLLVGLEDLSPEEYEARMRAWQAQFRRGRGDGNG